MTPVILEVILGILLLVYLVAALVREIRRLLRRTYHLVNGQVEYSYRYVMQNHYKASLVRAPYYEQLQNQPWRG